jgi:malonyl-CoA/methylmalonyl-CoA synthetase
MLAGITMSPAPARTFEHQTAAAQFLDFKPTLFFGVPTMYVRLLETPPDTAREIGQQMRLFVSGSAPLPAQTLEDFRSLFGHTILERYGMSETLMITRIRTMVSDDPEVSAAATRRLGQAR